MSEIRTLELRVNNNADEVQQQFENLRQQIAKTTQEVDELTSAYGENSQEVTEAKGRLNELNTSYKELNKSATDTGATFANVYGEMQPLTTRMGEAEDRLYELALAGQTATKEYQDLLKVTQNYLRVQQQVDLQVEAGAVPAAQQMTMAVGGVAGAFGIAEGAAALFGTESAKLAETMLKLQAAMTIVSGVAAFNEALPTFINFKNKVVDGFNGMSAAGKAFAITGIGLLLVGLGALAANWDKVKQSMTNQTAAQKVSNQVTAQAIASIANEISAADKLTKELNDETLSRAQKIQKVKEFQAAYPGLLKNVNLETQSIAQINEQLKKNITLLQLQAEVKAIEAVRAETLQGKVKTQLEELALAQEYAGEFTLDYGAAASNGFLSFSTGAENASKAQKKFSDIQNESTKKADKQIKALDAQKDAIDKQIKGLEKQGAQVGENTATVTDFSKSVASFTTATDAGTSAIDKQREALEKLNDLKQRIAQAEEEYLTSLLSQQEQEKKAVTDKYADLIREADKFNLDSMLLREAMEKGLADIDKKYADLAAEEKKKNEEAKLAAEKAAIEKANAEYEKGLSDRFQAELLIANEQQKELLNQRKTYQDQLDKINELHAKGVFANQIEYNQALQNLESENQKKTDDIKEKYAKIDEDRIKKLNEYRIQSVKDGLQIVSNLAELFAGKSEKQQKKAFQVQKAVNIATAVIDTYKAANTALASSPPPFNYIAMAAAITAGLVNVKKIASQQFQSSTTTPSSGSNAPEGAAPMTANFNTIGSSGINQLAQLQQTPTQAYVVSTEVTSAQALDRNRVQNATL
jgi:hypothetical protein